MQKRQIFIVDDSRVQRIILEKMLVAAGFSVQAFSAGNDLMDKLEQENPELVISDIDMPKLDGFELIEKIKNKFDELDCAFILISSNGGVPVENRAHQAGADLFLKKPFKYENLVEVIEDMLPNSEPVT